MIPDNIGRGVGKWDMEGKALMKCKYEASYHSGQPELTPPVDSIRVSAGHAPLSCPT